MRRLRRDAGPTASGMGRRLPTRISAHRHIYLKTGSAGMRGSRTVMKCERTKRAIPLTARYKPLFIRYLILLF